MRDWLCSFLILVLRFFFLGQGRGGDQEGMGELVKCTWGMLADLGGSRKEAAF
jgi:hypothetical protein